MNSMKQKLRRSLFCGSLVVHAALLHGGLVGSLEVDETFIEHHRVSEKLAEILDQHSKELARLVDAVHATERQKHGVWTFKWLPGYYVKYNVSRMVKRERISLCIQEENLHLLHTPEKYLYHLKERPTEFTSLNYVVICKKVHDSKDEYHIPMDLEQVQQFIMLIEKTGHLSTFEPNFLRLSDRRISFIDTDGSFNRDKPNTGFVRLLDRNLSHYYTAEALAYILDKIAEHLVLETDDKRRDKCLSDLDLYVSRQNTKVREKIIKVLAEYTQHYLKKRDKGTK